MLRIGGRRALRHVPSFRLSLQGSGARAPGPALTPWTAALRPVRSNQGLPPDLLIKTTVAPTSEVAPHLVKGPEWARPGRRGIRSRASVSRRRA
eukprot:232057-Hanusia_phi.AAC.1